MGLLSSIGKALGKSATKVLDTLTVAIAHPIKTIEAVVSKEKTISQLTEAHFAQPVGKQVTDILIGGAGIAATVVTAGKAATAAKAGTLGAAAKSLIPATTKGKIIAGVAAPIALGAVVNQPAKTLGAVAKTPSSLANVGANVANLVADPSLKNVKTLVSENPVVVGGLATAGAVATGVGVASLASGVLTRQEMKKQTEAFERQAAATEAQLAAGVGGTTTTTTLPKEKVTPTDEGIPTTTPTTTITTGKKRRRRRVIKEKPSVRQNVRVNIINRPKATGIRLSRTKKYLNTQTYIR